MTKKNEKEPIPAQFVSAKDFPKVATLVIEWRPPGEKKWSQFDKITRWNGLASFAQEQIDNLSEGYNRAEPAKERHYQFRALVVYTETLVLMTGAEIQAQCDIIAGAKKADA